jgi:hypothetical protein
VGIGPDDGVAAHHQSLFGQQRVLDAHLTHLEIVDDALAEGEAPHARTLSGGGNVLVGREVVGNQRHLLAIEYASRAAFLEFSDRNGRSDVVAQHQIQRAVDKLPGGDRRESGVAGQYPLGHRHAHTRHSFFCADFSASSS